MKREDLIQSIKTKSESRFPVFLHEYLKTHDKASLNKQDQYGFTPLLHAVRTGHLKTVELLLSYEVDIEIKDNIQYTALMWAVYNNYSSIIQLLISKGADLKVVFNDVFLIWSINAQISRQFIYDAIAQAERLIPELRADSHPDIIAEVKAHNEKIERHKMLSVPPTLEPLIGNRFRML